VNMQNKRPVTVACGDGIGPEIMAVTLKILEAAGAQIEPEVIEIGEKVYLSGHTAGITTEAWDSLRRTRVFLKAPITTPLGGGYKSINVTTRKTLGLYANVRPCVAYHPFIATRHPKMDVVIIRENEEDLYAGIEHRQTTDVVQCLKLISRPGTEKIIHYAFAYARKQGRKKVTCFTKDNIMKETDGLFHRIFDQVAARYPELETEHLIIDIGCARLADTPEQFDVIVTSNLYGDIISDVAAQISGSVGLGGSANIGETCAMFEAIHGSAPMIAGQNIANPSGLILAAVQMLLHIDQAAIAGRIHNAWLKTIEDGIHTADVYQAGTSQQQVGTRAFGEAVIARLGQLPEKLAPVTYPDTSAPEPSYLYQRPQEKKELVGVDLFLDWKGHDPEQLSQQLRALPQSDLKLKMITNRGVKVWPDGFPETMCTDHWRCRFIPAAAQGVTHTQVIALLQACQAAGLDFIKTENLYTFDGVKGYSLGQGE
jgi:isocitrate dehydrogenase